MDKQQINLKEAIENAKNNISNAEKTKENLIKQIQEIDSFISVHIGHVQAFEAILTGRVVNEQTLEQGDTLEVRKMKKVSNTGEEQ